MRTCIKSGCPDVHGKIGSCTCRSRGSACANNLKQYRQGIAAITFEIRTIGRDAQACALRHHDASGAEGSGMAAWLVQEECRAYYCGVL